MLGSYSVVNANARPHAHAHVFGRINFEVRECFSEGGGLGLQEAKEGSIEKIIALHVSLWQRAAFCSVWSM